VTRLAAAALALALSAPVTAAAGIEHADEAAADLHDSPLGTAHLHRPTSPTAAHLMASLRCMCPGCLAQRVSILACKCDVAAQQREEVLAALAGRDLSTPERRQRAEAEVIAQAVARHGQLVLGTPGSSWAWAAPAAAAAAGLVLVLGLGLRWVRRGRPAPVSDDGAVRDDALEARLDDELLDL
jgi:cytochrome c-type biogenesis protein CcmH/NrfF